MIMRLNTVMGFSTLKENEGQKVFSRYCVLRGAKFIVVKKKFF